MNEQKIRKILKFFGSDYKFEVFNEVKKCEEKQIIQEMIKELKRKKEIKLYSFLMYSNSRKIYATSKYKLHFSRYYFFIYLFKKNQRLIFLQKPFLYGYSVFFVVETKENVNDLIKKYLIKKQLKEIAN